MAVGDDNLLMNGIHHNLHNARFHDVNMAKHVECLEWLVCADELMGTARHTMNFALFSYVTACAMAVRRIVVQPGARGPAVIHSLVEHATREGRSVHGGVLGVTRVGGWWGSAWAAGRTHLEWPLAAGKAQRAREVMADLVVSWVRGTATPVQVSQVREMV